MQNNAIQLGHVSKQFSEGLFSAEVDGFGVYQNDDWCQKCHSIGRMQEVSSLACFLSPRTGQVRKYVYSIGEMVTQIKY